MAGLFDNLTLLPASGEEFAPEVELASYVDPDDIPVQLADADKLPIGTNGGYDLTTGQFTGQRFGGLDSIVQVLKIALITPRGRHPGMFPDTFGMEDPERMLGKVVTSDLQMEHERDVRETLLAAHDRVAEIPSISFVYNPDDTFANMTVVIVLDSGASTELTV